MAISLDRPVALSKLDAVNLILAARGDNPTAALGASASRSGVEAEDALAAESQKVQTETAWNFNTDEDLRLTPNDSGFIYLPENLHRFRLAARSGNLSVVERGGRLYDRANHTFVFSQDVYVDATFVLAYDDLPQPARWYIALRAAFQVGNQKMPGDPSLRPDANQVSMAKASLQSFDLGLGVSNLVGTSPHFNRMRRRR